MAVQDERFKRGKWIRVTVGGQVFEYKGTSEHGDRRKARQYDIRYTYNFSIWPEPPHGSIRIYNLLDRSTALFEAGEEVKLEAGWEDQEQPFWITTAEIGSDVRGYAEGVDWVDEINFVEAKTPYLTALVARTWKADPCTAAGPTCLAITKAIVGELGLPWAYCQPKRTLEHMRGLSLYEPAFSALRREAKEMQSFFYIYQGEAYLIPADGGFPTNDVLCPENGLLKVVKGEQLSVPGDATLTYGAGEPRRYLLWTVFDPRWRPGALVHLRTYPEGVAPEEDDLDLNVRIINGKHYCEGEEQLTELHVEARGN